MQAIAHTHTDTCCHKSHLHTSSRDSRITINKIAFIALAILAIDASAVVFFSFAAIGGIYSFYSIPNNSKQQHSHRPGGCGTGFHQEISGINPPEEFTLFSAFCAHIHHIVECGGHAAHHCHKHVQNNAQGVFSRIGTFLAPVAQPIKELVHGFNIFVGITGFYAGMYFGKYAATAWKRL